MNAERLEAEGHALVSRGHALLAEAVKVRTATALPLIYSTATGADLPPIHPSAPLGPKHSARWLRDHAEEMGGVRVGGKRGRGVVWSITREQYEAWHSRSSVTDAPKLAPVVSIDALITAGGYRATRSA